MPFSFAQVHKKALSELLKQSPVKNQLAVPKIKKIVVNVSTGRLVVQHGEKALEPITKDLARICGQKAAPRPAKKSIAAFKVREGLPVGLAVTLRGSRAQDFFTRLVSVALPRQRDFRGIDQKSIDAHGNLTIGIREQTAFPEAAFDPTGVVFGFEVTIVTNATSREEAQRFFRLMGMPLKSEQ